MLWLKGIERLKTMAAALHRAAPRSISTPS
jgi:hypothetical protein